MAPRNITANLLKVTGASYMFVEPEGPTNNLAKEAADLLAKEGTEITLLPMLVSHILTVDVKLASSIKPKKVNDDEIMLILHSSGRVYLRWYVRMY
jgi:hypothetical protein